MAPQTEVVDYGAFVADDFTKWSAGWTWTWNSQKVDPRDSSTTPKSRGLSGDCKPQGEQTPQLSPREAYIASISAAVPPAGLSPPPILPVKPLFTTEYFEVRPSPKGGLGAFATREIPCGTVIHREQALFTGTSMEVFYLYEQLSPDQRREYLGLHEFKGVGGHKILSIFKTNRFEFKGCEGAIFLKSSRFNHACHPHSTCTYTVNRKEKTIKITALFDIKEGQEITISYGPYPANLPWAYGFYCDCPSCPPPAVAEEEAKMLRGPG